MVPHLQDDTTDKLMGLLEQNYRKCYIMVPHESIKHSCEYCKYEATTKGNLYNHVQSIHIQVEYSLSIVNMKQL